MFPHETVEELARELHALRERKGRLFCIGVGGSAANASHAVNDFRKLCGIEAYAFDNMAELTARTNDEGWATVFSAWLEANNCTAADAVMVFSVGGGTPNVSANLVAGINTAKARGMRVLGIVGRDGGHTKIAGDCVVVVPVVEPLRVTPHTEAFQLVVLHCLVSHSLLQRSKTTW
jgi:D-sedoheptulose 7-phosphate isomerase